MLTIRKFNHTNQDFADVVAIYNADWPDEPITIEEWRHYLDVRNPNFLDQQFVMEQTGEQVAKPEMVATFRIWESEGSYVPGKYRIEYCIHPNALDQGIDEQIYQYITAYVKKRNPAPQFLDTKMREDRSDRIRFWTNHGFEIVMREPKSELIVTNYDFSRFDGAFQKVANHGIQILTMTELQQRDPKWLRHYYNLFWLIINDVPSADKRTPIPFEKWRKRITDSPNLLPEANFFALDGDQWVGTSNLWKDASNKENLNVGVTGVLPSHRRQGIATALKLKTFDYAIEYGAITLKTGNEENNPMYELNLALGFKPKPAWLSLRKTL
ncbi:MAG: GNAT family N-acetyltransferase [Chloroflexota bacterium]